MIGRPKNYIEECLTGRLFTRLLVIGDNPVKQGGRRKYWLCRCDCGVEKLVGKILLLNGRSKSCGCLQKELVAEMGRNNKGKKNPGITGDKHPNWKGGVTSKYILKRTGAENLEWRRLVYEKDKYTCQKCGDDKGGNLNAHHITNFSSVYDKEDEVFMDVNNGITFCIDCHKKFHFLYGIKSNSMEQIKEFLSDE